MFACFNFPFSFFFLLGIGFFFPPYSLLFVWSSVFFQFIQQTKQKYMLEPYFIGADNFIWTLAMCVYRSLAMYKLNIISRNFHLAIGTKNKRRSKIQWKEKVWILLEQRRKKNISIYTNECIFINDQSDAWSSKILLKVHSFIHSSDSVPLLRKFFFFFATFALECVRFDFFFFIRSFSVKFILWNDRPALIEYWKQHKSWYYRWQEIKNSITT